MVHVGNHIKMSIPLELRSRTRDFYGGLLECKALASPRPDLDLYEFAGGFVLGLFFVETAQAPTEADYLKAVWLELKVEEPAVWKSRLQTFGVREVDYPDPDPTHFYFHAPGGQVFRLASMEGGR